MGEGKFNLLYYLLQDLETLSKVPIRDSRKSAVNGKSVHKTNVTLLVPRLSQAKSVYGNTDMWMFRLGLCLARFPHAMLA
jgi:hypothetical protein